MSGARIRPRTVCEIRVRAQRWVCEIPIPARQWVCGFRVKARRPRSTFLALLAVVWTGCSINTNRIVGSDAHPVADAAALARTAETAFAERPRQAPNVRDAFSSMSAATRSAEPPDRRRADYATRAARFAVWLAGHLEGDESEAYADSAITFANTAIHVDSTLAAPYYWRAIAAGIFARHNRLTLGRDAMTRIREDATRAIELDPTVEHAGPHRVLGALYLRAPGPPAGVGSLVRAVRELERAHLLDPEYPENRLLLAEAYIEQGKLEEASQLLIPILAGDMRDGDGLEREEWTREARALVREIDRRGARSP